MLQRSWRPSLRAIPLPQPHGCHVCKCCCGAIVNAFSPAPTQPRHRSNLPRGIAPSTDRKRRNQKDEVRNRRPTDEEERKQDLQHKQWWHNQALSHGPGWSTFGSILPFIEELCPLLDEAQVRPTADITRVKALMHSHDVTMADCETMSSWVFDPTQDTPRGQAHAKKLRLTLSRMGSTVCTLRVMADAVEQQKSRANTLKSPEIQYARAHLTQLASRDSMYQAMVLEGKVARALGDEERAIALWTQAMDNAVKYSDARSAKGDFSPDPLELSSPWIELTMIHVKRSKPPQNKNEYDKAVWAMDIGCEQDDPISHFHAAEYKQKYMPDGTHKPTADWLYHMTKAATSGYQKAIHEVAVFYAQSGWKYIEDEPPDHMKPTPFDSYPVNWLASTTTTFRQFLGLEKRKAVSARDGLYRTAIFPSTAKERFQLALQWLEVNHKYYYAPSYLFHAQLLMEKTLWGMADAPKSALNLSEDRYTYASKEDHDAYKPIPREPEPEPKDISNPFYNPDAAKKSLREVFFAYEAHVRRKGLEDSFAKRRREGFWQSAENVDDATAENRLSHWPEHERKWMRNPEVREMYEDGIEGLYATAKEICNEQGWSMVDDEGGLLYRPVVKVQSLKKEGKR